MRYGVVRSKQGFKVLEGADVQALRVAAREQGAEYVSGSADKAQAERLKSHLEKATASK